VKCATDTSKQLIVDNRESIIRFVIYPPKPERNLIAPITAYVQVDDDDGQERRQCDNDHIETEIRTSTHQSPAFIYNHLYKVLVVM